MQDPPTAIASHTSSIHSRTPLKQRTVMKLAASSGFKYLGLESLGGIIIMKNNLLSMYDFFLFVVLLLEFSYSHWIPRYFIRVSVSNPSRRMNEKRWKKSSRTIRLAFIRILGCSWIFFFIKEGIKGVD